MKPSNSFLFVLISFYPWILFDYKDTISLRFGQVKSLLKWEKIQALSREVVRDAVAHTTA